MCWWCVRSAGAMSDPNFPPPGWYPHPGAAGCYHNGKIALWEADLRALVPVPVLSHDQAPPEVLHGIPFQHLRKGSNCKSCGRFIKVNRKKLNRTMLQYLFKMYLVHSLNDGWLEASRVRIRAKSDPSRKENELQSGDYKILRLWGLAELHPKRSGWMRITPFGIDFLEMKSKVRQSVLLENYKNRLICFEGKWVDAFEAYGTSFTLKEL